MAYLDDGHRDEAERVLDRVMEGISPDDVRYGIWMLEARREVELMLKFERAAAERAADWRLLLTLAIRARDRGDLDVAREYAERAVESDEPLALSVMGHLVLERGDVESAAQWYERARKRGATDKWIPFSPEELRPEVWNQEES